MAAQTQAEFGTVADVAAAKAAETEPPLVVPSVLTPMQLALLQLAGYGLTEGLDQVPPYFMQSLAEDYAQPPATQLGAALAAMRHGSLSAERFSQLSQLSDLTAFQNPAEADAALNTPPPDAVFLALRLLEVDAQPINAQPSALVNALAQAQSRGLWRDMVLLLDDRLRNLQAASDGANAAPAFPADAPLAPFAPAFEAENGTDETGPGIEAAAQADRTYGDALHAALLPAMQLLAWADALSADSSAPADVLSASPAALSFTPSAMAERILQFGDMPQTLGDLIAALAD